MKAVLWSCLLLLGLFALLASSGTHRIYADGEPAPVDPVAAVASDDPATRNQALTSLESARSTRINALIEIARTNIDDPQRGVFIAADAIHALGDERAIEAVPFLVEHLTFSPTVNTNILHGPAGRGAGPYEVHPCMWALMSIGNPSLGPLIEAVERRDPVQDKYFAGCTAVVIFEVLGTTNSRAYLRGLMEATTDEVAKQRLAEVAKVLGGV
jgi:hypothetical protein